MHCLAVCVMDDMSCRYYVLCFFFQAEDGIRDLVRSRGLGDVYKRQSKSNAMGGRGFKNACHIRTLAEQRHKTERKLRVHLSLIHI